MNLPAHPLVSIIIPVYNVEEYVSGCLDSVRQQTWENLEIILVEDCSTDESLIHLQPHLSDPRVRLMRHAVNQGLSAARNTGMDAATGDYILFVDSDDLIHPRLVETCVEHAQSNPQSLVVFDHCSFQDGNSDFGFSQLPEKIKVEFPDLSTYLDYPKFAWLKFVRRSALSADSVRFHRGLYYEDWPFHCELWFQFERVDHLAFEGYGYRVRGDSITASRGEKLLHMLVSQNLVVRILSRQGIQDPVRSVVTASVYSALWYLLINIDDAHLQTAVAQSRSHIQFADETVKLDRPKGWRSKTIHFLLKMPETIGVPGLRAVRFIVENLSPARRSIRQDLGGLRQRQSS